MESLQGRFQLQLRLPLFITFNRSLVQRKDFVKSCVNITGHLVNNAEDSVRSLDRFPQCLPDANIGFTAVSDVLLVGLAAAMLVHVAPVKHSLSERLVIIRQILRNVDVEYFAHVAFDGLKIVEANLFKARSSPRCHRHTPDELLDVLADKRIKRRDRVFRAGFERSTRIDSAAYFRDFLLAENM